MRENKMQSNVRYSDGNQHKCYFFWRPNLEDGYLSNWLYSRFKAVDEDTGKTIDFYCSEQYFMWSKAKLFGDDEIAQKILEAKYDPKLYKELGKEVKGFDQKTWDINKFVIMVEGNYRKFTDPRNVKLKNSLLGTGEAILAEASPYDKIWGIGIEAVEGKEEEFGDIRGWKGQNLLGKALMVVRDKIREEEKKRKR